MLLLPLFLSGIATCDSLFVYGTSTDSVCHAGVPSLAKALFKSSDPYKHFLPLLAHSNNPEDPVPLLTSTVLATLMARSKDESQSTENALPLILSYLCSLAKNANDAGLQDIAVTEYSSLLYGKASRQLFWKQRSETVAPLIDILRKAAGVGADSSASLWSGNATVRTGGGFEGAIGGGVGLQLLYHVLLVMWQLSFEGEDIGDEMDEYVQSPGTFCISISNNTTVNMILFFYIHNSCDHPRRKRPRAYCFRPCITFSAQTQALCCLRRYWLGSLPCSKMSGVGT